MKTFTLLFVVVLVCSCATYRDLPTSELKLQHHQCVEQLAHQPKWEFKFGGNPWDQPGDERRSLVKKKNKYESELLKRYKAGDKEAYLTIFEP